MPTLLEQFRQRLSAPLPTVDFVFYWIPPRSKREKEIRIPILSRELMIARTRVRQEYPETTEGHIHYMYSELRQ